MLLFKVTLVTIFIKWVTCAIAGLSYMDPINQKFIKQPAREEDPCNPLYWYPREIPEFCKNRKNLFQMPLPLPPPMPMPPPYPFPAPLPPMAPLYPPVPFPLPPLPMPIYPPSMPLPFGIPLSPTNPMLPVAGVPVFPSMPYQNPMPYGPQQQLGMVPGIPGLVTRDGGINVLPFSDAYSDLLDKHKRRMRRKKTRSGSRRVRYRY